MRLREKPYAKTSVSEICERAGVSRKTLYVRFRDKEAVVEELFCRHVVEPQLKLNEMLSLERA